MTGPSQNGRLTLAEIQQRWRRRPLPDLNLLSGKRCSAVALIFQETRGELKLCVGRRARYPGDPWSGDMALPGGKAEPQDQTFIDVACREAAEETGLELSADQLIGTLDILQTFATPHRPALHVRPLLFALSGTPPPFQPNDELEAAFWVPVCRLWQPEARTELAWRERTFTGIRWQEDIIWGLTLRILGQFAEAIGRPL